MNIVLTIWTGVVAVIVVMHIKTSPSNAKSHHQGHSHSSASFIRHRRQLEAASALAVGYEAIGFIGYSVDQIKSRLKDTPVPTPLGRGLCKWSPCADGCESGFREEQRAGTNEHPYGGGRHFIGFQSDCWGMWRYRSHCCKSDSSDRSWSGTWISGQLSDILTISFYSYRPKHTMTSKTTSTHISYNGTDAFETSRCGVITYTISGQEGVTEIFGSFCDMVVILKRRYRAFPGMLEEFGSDEIDIYRANHTIRYFKTIL